MSEESLICSFCSKSRKDVTKMIVGARKTSICNECVKLCVEILEEDVIKARKEKLYSGDKQILNPVAIKEHLDQYVIGQDTAKTILSVGHGSQPSFRHRKSILLAGSHGAASIYITWGSWLCLWSWECLWVLGVLVVLGAVVALMVLGVLGGRVCCVCWVCW